MDGCSCEKNHSSVCLVFVIVLANLLKANWSHTKSIYGNIYIYLNLFARCQATYR